MKEFIVDMLALLTIIVTLAAGILIGQKKANRDFSYELSQVGIEKIMKCNNT